MIDYINVKLTVNYDDEIERAVELLSRMCDEAYVGTTRPYNPSWCTVDVRLGKRDDEGSFEIGCAEITVLRKDAPLLRGLVDHVFGNVGWSWRELSGRAEEYEAYEQDTYGRRVA